MRIFPNSTRNQKSYFTQNFLQAHIQVYVCYFNRNFSKIFLMWTLFRTLTLLRFYFQPFIKHYHSHATLCGRWSYDPASLPKSIFMLCLILTNQGDKLWWESHNTWSYNLLSPVMRINIHTYMFEHLNT